MSDSIETSFRRESARIVSTLTRVFGPAHLGLAEDAVQEAFLRAMRLWPTHGTPANPTGWLTTVARNHLRDQLRRERIYVPGGDYEIATPPSEPEELGDDELRMLFLCCHPRLSPESQIALTLKTLGGLGTPEVARALLVQEDTVSQRILRARKALADETFELPNDFDSRLDVVLRVLYLVFNEGYAATLGDGLMRPELCQDAISLTRRLVGHPRAALPKVHALLSLMLLQSSRCPARLDPTGGLCLLEDQDRTRWDSGLISLGLRHLELAASGGEMSAYHCEAAIAACHAIAPTFADTDWRLIQVYYEDLVRIAPSDVARLNRAVALGMVYGPQEALAQIADLPRLANYPLFWATRARFAEMAGQDDKEAWAKALSLATNDVERSYLHGRLRS